jgi:magnesium chelatase family protein
LEACTDERRPETASIFGFVSVRKREWVAMSVTRVTTVAFAGIEARPVDVQVHVGGHGNPGIFIVGLPDKAVGESRERVRAAVTAIGLGVPGRHITVNLAPADMPKEGSHFDLPIALGILAAMGVIPRDEIEGYVALGELSLDGAIAPVAGVLPATITAAELNKSLICPASCGAEAAWVGGVDVVAAPGLIALINHIKGDQVLPAPTPRLANDDQRIPDLKDVKGQETAKRALEIAAAGGHNMLMIGPPGAGKSMLAARLPGLLPPLDAREALEVSMIQSLAGELKDGAIGRRRPFRAPHHSASMAAMVGGGLRVRPGEASLAHLGVLFLDELPEFSRQVLDSLRAPLESGFCVVARANAHVRYPSRVQLVAAANPCRCGFMGDPAQECARVPRCGQDYLSRISGPMLDRIDLHVEVASVNPADLSLPPPREDTEAVARRVYAARDRQRARFSEDGIRTNAEADGEFLESISKPDAAGQKLLADAAEKMRLTARGYHRVLKVARTIADLAARDAVTRPDIAEALSYRRLNFG